MSMEDIANAPIEVDIKSLDGKTYRFAVRTLTIRQRAEWGAKLKAIARREWSKRVAEIASNLNHQDRLDYLSQVAKSEPDLENEMSKLRFEAESIGSLLSIASGGKLTQEIIDNADASASDEIGRATYKSLGITPQSGDVAVNPTQPTTEVQNPA